MGHIPLNVVNFARDGRRTVRIPVPSSGLNLREDWQSNDSSKGVMMKKIICLLMAAVVSLNIYSRAI